MSTATPQSRAEYGEFKFMPNYLAPVDQVEIFRDVDIIVDGKRVATIPWDRPHGQHERFVASADLFVPYEGAAGQKVPVTFDEALAKRGVPFDVRGGEVVLGAAALPRSAVPREMVQTYAALHQEYLASAPEHSTAGPRDRAAEARQMAEDRANRMAVDNILKRVTSQLYPGATGIAQLADSRAVVPEAYRASLERVAPRMAEVLRQTGWDLNVAGKSIHRNLLRQREQEAARAFAARAQAHAQVQEQAQVAPTATATAPASPATDHARVLRDLLMRSQAHLPKPLEIVTAAIGPLDEGRLDHATLRRAMPHVVDCLDPMWMDGPARRDPAVRAEFERAKAVDQALRSPDADLRLLAEIALDRETSAPAREPLREQARGRDIARVPAMAF